MGTKKTEVEVIGVASNEVLARVERHGDLFEPMLELKQRLPV